MEDEDFLLLLASKYLSPELQGSAKLLLKKRKAFTTVRVCLLYAIDSALARGIVDDEDALRDYKTLGFSLDEACRIRQNATRPFY